MSKFKTIAYFSRDVKTQNDLGKNIPWPRAPKGFEQTHEIMKKVFLKWRAYKVSFAVFGRVSLRVIVFCSVLRS